MANKKQRVIRQQSIEEPIEELELPSDDPDKVYEVEAILDDCSNFKGKKGELRYLIAWKGYDASYNTWEPVEMLEGCPEMLKKYNDNLERERAKNQDVLKNGKGKCRRASGKLDPAYMYKYEGFDLRTVQANDIPEDQRNDVYREVAICHYGLMSSWEKVVQKISGVRTMEDGYLVFDLDFDRVFEFSFKLAVVKERCPHKLIDYLIAQNGLQPFQENAANLPQQNQIMTQTNQSLPQAPLQAQDHTMEANPRSEIEVEDLIEQMAAPWEHTQA